MTLIDDVFPKLWTRKDLLRSMSKKSRLNGSFQKQHRKCDQTLFKCQSQLFYHYLLIIVKAIYLKKVSVSEMQILKTVS